MGLMTEVVRNLLVIIIIATFLEAILPQGNIKPMVRFVIGLFIIIAILGPAVQYLLNQPNLEIEAWNEQNDQSLTSQIESGRQKIDQQISQQSNDMLKQKVEGQISAVAVLVPGVDGVETRVILGSNGVPQKLDLTVRASKTETQGGSEPVNVFSNVDKDVQAKEESQIQSKLRQVLGNLYGLKAEDIEIQFEGG